MRDHSGREVEVTEDELFGRAIVDGLWQLDPETARRCEPGPASDHEHRSEDDAAAELAAQIRKEIDSR